MELDWDLLISIQKVCADNQETREPSGKWYIKTSGLRKVAKLAGVNWDGLSRKGRKRFHFDCVDCAQGNMTGVKLDGSYHLIH